MLAPVNVKAPVVKVPTDPAVALVPFDPGLRIAPAVVLPKVTDPLIVPVPPSVVPLLFTLTAPVPSPSRLYYSLTKYPAFILVVPL